MSSPSELYIGLMSGTSMDGIDAALVDFKSSTPKLIATYNQPWPDDIHKLLIKARELPDDQLGSLKNLDLLTSEVFAEACFHLLAKTTYQSRDIVAVGNHGQTIRHRPEIVKPFSLQIGNAQRLAALTGIDVISDFRTADIKAGGQGAPLAPGFHQAVFQDNSLNRVIVNIGGIANITRLTKDNSLDVSGFDCGPGNTLMDAWISQYNQQPFDANGAFAAKGKTSASLLANLLMDDYFQLAPPKSTGFEYFNLNWLQLKLDELQLNEMTAADIQSTLCDLTAISIIRSINQYAEDTDEIFICGGGIHNKTLMHRLQLMTKCPIRSTEELGVHPDWVEAMAFAWLAYCYNHKKTGNIPTVTGATQAVILGNITKKHTGLIA